MHPQYFSLQENIDRPPLMDTSTYNLWSLLGADSEGQELYFMARILRGTIHQQSLALDDQAVQEKTLGDCSGVGRLSRHDVPTSTLGITPNDLVEYVSTSYLWLPLLNPSTYTSQMLAFVLWMMSLFRFTTVHGGTSVWVKHHLGVLKIKDPPIIQCKPFIVIVTNQTF